MKFSVTGQWRLRPERGVSNASDRRRRDSCSTLGYAEGAGIGLSVEMKKMTVRQETIEVCEVFHLNPYQLTSTGAVLMVTPKGEELKERLKREGIPAEIIGHTTEGNERIIWGGGEKRFLDRPAPDELARIYEMKENVNA